MNEERITSRRIEPDDRLEFLPRHLGNRCVAFETFAFTIMDRACETYRGGIWCFYELSNGGFYIAPDHAAKLRLVWPDNYFEGTMTPDAAGIGVSLFALSHLSFEVQSEAISEKFHLLRAFAMQHPEASAIFGFID